MNNQLKELQEFIDTFYGGDTKTFTAELSKAIYYLHFTDAECCDQKDIRNTCFLLHQVCELLNEDFENENKKVR